MLSHWARNFLLYENSEHDSKVHAYGELYQKKKLFCQLFQLSRELWITGFFNLLDKAKKQKELFGD